MQGGVLQCEFHLAFPQDSRLVGRHESDTFGELADASGPAVEQAKLQRNDRHLRHPNEIDDADQNKIASHFLANFFAQERALQVGQDAGRLHGANVVTKLLSYKVPQKR